jgi:hypothetical protein
LSRYNGFDSPFFFFCFPFLFVADIFFLTPPYLTIGPSLPPTDGVLSVSKLPHGTVSSPPGSFHLLLVKRLGQLWESHLGHSSASPKDRFSLVADGFCIYYKLLHLHQTVCPHPVLPFHFPDPSTYLVETTTQPWKLPISSSPHLRYIRLPCGTLVYIYKLLPLHQTVVSG